MCWALPCLFCRLVAHPADHQLPCMLSGDQAGLPHCLFLLDSQSALIVSPAFIVSYQRPAVMPVFKDHRAARDCKWTQRVRCNQSS